MWCSGEFRMLTALSKSIFPPPRVGQARAGYHEYYSCRFLMRTQIAICCMKLYVPCAQLTLPSGHPGHGEVGSGGTELWHPLRGAAAAPWRWLLGSIPSSTPERFGSPGGKTETSMKSLCLRVVIGCGVIGKGTQISTKTNNRNVSLPWKR